MRKEIIGKCILYNEDNKTLLRRLVADSSIDMVLTSPPYDNARAYTGFEWDFENLAKELPRVLKPGGVIVWVANQMIDKDTKGESLTAFEQAIYFVRRLGLILHDTMIYEKSGVAFPDPARYKQAFEYMFVFSKGPPKTINLIRDVPVKTAGRFCKIRRRNKDSGLTENASVGAVRLEFQTRSNVWRFGSGTCVVRDDDALEHPAVFPYKLARDQIITWTYEGDAVLDPFMGSGTTAVECHLYNRRCIGVELSEKYFDMEVRILKRVCAQRQFDFGVGA